MLFLQSPQLQRPRCSYSTHVAWWIESQTWNHRSAMNHDCHDWSIAMIGRYWMRKLHTQCDRITTSTGWEVGSIETMIVSWGWGSIVKQEVSICFWYSSSRSLFKFHLCQGLPKLTKEPDLSKQRLYNTCTNSLHVSLGSFTWRDKKSWFPYWRPVESWYTCQINPW